jgi:hypothetical protein
MQPAEEFFYVAHEIAHLGGAEIHGDLPHQPVRLFVLPRPHVLDRWSVAGQAAVFVLLAATAGTGIVSSDLLTRMKGTHALHGAGAIAIGLRFCNNYL